MFRTYKKIYFHPFNIGVKKNGYSAMFTILPERVVSLIKL